MTQNNTTQSGQCEALRARSRHAEEPILDRWTAEAESDPMPEVRYALSDPKN